MYNITFVFFTWVLAWRKTLKTCTYRQTHLPQQVTGAYRSGELVKQQLNRVHSHFQEQYFHSTMCLAGISLSESLVDKNSQLVVMTFTGVFLPITWWLFSVAYLLCNLYHNELTDTKNDLIMTPSHGCIMSQLLAHLYANRFCFSSYFCFRWELARPHISYRPYCGSLMSCYKAKVL